MIRADAHPGGEIVPAGVRSAGPDGSVLRLRASGVFDIANQALLAEAVHAAVTDDHDVVEVDLEQATFIDVSVIRALVGGYRRAVARGRTLRVVNPHGVSVLVLRATGTAELLCGFEPEPQPTTESIAEATTEAIAEAETLVERSHRAAAVSRLITRRRRSPDR